MVPALTGFAIQLGKWDTHNKTTQNVVKDKEGHTQVHEAFKRVIAEAYGEWGVSYIGEGT